MSVDLDEILATRKAEMIWAANYIWRPIDTAPKDGTRILVFAPWDDDDDGEVYLASFGYDIGNGPSWQPEYAEVAMFQPDDERAPTHWMPLPDGPTPSKERNDGR